MVQRAKRYHVGVVGIGLAASSGTENPHLHRECRGHVHDILVGCDENLGDPATKAVGSLDRQTAGRPSRVRFANAAGVAALTTNLRVAKLVPELSIATAVSPQFQRRDMAVTGDTNHARPYGPAGLTAAG